MDIFCCKISNLIYFLLIIYFILMVVGPSTSDKKEDCITQIYQVFKIDEDKRENKQDHFSYAVLNLRKLTKQEIKAYVQTNILEEGVKYLSLENDDEHPLLYDAKHVSLENDDEHQEDVEYPLLYNSVNNTIVHNKYPYEYFLSITDGYNKKQISVPKFYCKDFEGKDKADCNYTLKYFGLTGDARKVINYAFLSIVYDDLTSNRLTRPGIKKPKNISFAQEYMKEIAYGGKGHYECYEKIYEVFKILEGDRRVMREHFKYAVLNLREPTSKEEEEYVQKTKYDLQEDYKYLYIQNIASIGLEDPQNPFLFVGDSEQDKIINNGFAYLYYRNLKFKLAFLIDTSRVLGQFKSPTVYCSEPNIDKEACEYSLNYFRFTGNAVQIIQYAFINIVLDDITSGRKFRKNMDLPGDVLYAKNYLEHIANEVYDERMQIPYRYCEKFSKAR